MIPKRLSDIEALRARIGLAIADEEQTGRFARQLRLAFERASVPTSDALLARELERVRDALTLLPQRLTAFESAKTKIASARHRRAAVLAAILAYSATEQDVIPDSVGLLGLVDDAIVAYALLARFNRWHRDTLGAPLTADDYDAPAMSLRALLADEVDRLLMRVVDALWEERETGTLLAERVDAKNALVRSSPVSASLRTRGPKAARPMATVEETETGARRFDVWFATNRALLDGRDPAPAFGPDRDAKGIVRYGTCAVEIPKSHRFGSTGTAWWRRWLRLEFSDDRIKVLRRELFADDQTFFAELRAELGSLAEDAHQVLFYLHGFNVSFDEAAIRAAQLFADLQPPGAAAFFSWPSKASVEEYFADGERISASEADIAGFLTRLATELDGATIHIIAHSMGNRGLARAIQRITSAATREAGVRFGQIILAAPDIDMTLFQDLARVYPRISDRTTMYVSARDRALGLSRWLQDSQRAGFTPPVTVVPDIDTIEVTQVDVTALGHGYYAEARPVLYDIADLLRHGSPPERRTGLRRGDVAKAASPYWTIVG